MSSVLDGAARHEGPPPPPGAGGEGVVGDRRGRPDPRGGLRLPARPPAAALRPVRRARLEPPDHQAPHPPNTHLLRRLDQSI